MVSVSGIDIKFGRILGAIALVAVLIVLYKHYGSGKVTVSNELGGEKINSPASSSVATDASDIKPDGKVGLNTLMFDSYS